MQGVTFLSCETFTQDEFAEWLKTLPPDDLHHYELLDGHIVMEPPAGWPHGETGAILARLVGNFVQPRKLGRVFESSQGFALPSGDTVEPDLSFISRERWEADPRRPHGFPRAVPDLIVETLSPSTRRIDRWKKKRIYERNGVREYWLVDPKSRSVTRFVASEGRFDTGTVFGQNGTLASVVLDGLEIRVAELFPEP